MLVSRCVVHSVDPRPLHDPVYKRCVAYGTEMRMHRNVRKPFRQFALDAVERVFGVIQKMDLPRCKRHDLSAKFTAYGASCAGDQKSLPADALCEQFGMRPDGFPSEQILQLDLAYRLYRDFFVRHFHYAANCLDRDA